MEEQNQVARKLENESAVLLKNNSVLPIGKEKESNHYWRACQADAISGRWEQSYPADEDDKCD